MNIAWNILNLVPEAQLLYNTGGLMGISESGDAGEGGKFCLTCSSPMRIGFSAIEHIAKKIPKVKIQKKNILEPRAKN